MTRNVKRTLHSGIHRSCRATVLKGSALMCDAHCTGTTSPDTAWFYGGGTVVESTSVDLSKSTMFSFPSLAISEVYYQALYGYSLNPMLN